MRLKPLRSPRKSERIIEKQILSFIEEEIFAKIISAFEEENKILNNSKNEIINRLNKNEIEFYNNKFKGKFSSSISSTFRKLGATFNKVDNSFSFKDPASMPFDIQTAIASQQTNATFLNETVLSEIDNLNINLDNIDFASNYEDVIKNLDKKFKGNIKIAGIDFNDLLPEAKEQIAKEWSENLKLYVKDFVDEQVIELRNFVQQNATQGFRASNLEKKLQKQFNISKNKAKFLARQETSLFTANYAKQRYQIAGVDEYIWSTSQDERVRDDHKRLNGKKFSFDNPPIVDLNTGKTANPGEDFCRCVAIPVI
jgi:SPP1 gp7 family putative phage head morphogenesis protein